MDKKGRRSKNIVDMRGVSSNAMLSHWPATVDAQGRGDWTLQAPDGKTLPYRNPEGDAMLDKWARIKKRKKTIAHGDR